MEGKWERVKRTAGTWVNFSSRNGINSQVDKPRAGLVISILLRPCVIIWPGRRWKTIPFNLYRSRIISFFFWFHGNFHAWNFVRVSYYFRSFS